MQMQQGGAISRGESPQPVQTSRDLEQSFDILVSKHMIPPPLMLLPKPQVHQPKSLTPMLPLPAFVGIIPNFQPLDKPINHPGRQLDYSFNWIGEAFDRVVYRRYDEESYKKVDNVDEHWNIWACDVAKLTGRKSAQNITPDQTLQPYYTPVNSEDRTLVFQSRFECGNLSLVSKVTDNQYNLLLQNDINTNGYSQWFFFKVSNTLQDHRVKFKILNQYKQNNLYKMGMKIVVYSKKESEEKNLSWHRCGDNIQYYQNGYSRSSTEYRPYFTLSWDYVFPHSDDQVYFAYSYPYTFTNLESFFSKIQNDAHMRTICHRTPLCKTLAGNTVDVLTITQNHQFMEIDKGYIIITARIHPGQSISSYVTNGIVDFLLSNDDKARKLRQNFIFKIIPMLNPDGVIHGNYRSNISGYDLNKKWHNPSKIYQPQIFYLKKLILNIQEVGDVLLFCDLHGHSMKKNAFVYGCHDTSNPRAGKRFPLLMSKLFKGFSMKDCSFLEKEEQEGTSRTFLVKELKHCDIYALESSFCGPQYDNIHFTVRHFEELGEKFCESLLIYFHERIKQMHVEAAMRNQAHFALDQADSVDGSLDQMRDFSEIDKLSLQDRVNSENSQLSEAEEESKIILEDRVIKRYLMMKYARPGTHLKRNNVLIRRSQSKDLGKMKLVDFLGTKSNSPVKRRELYETPQKVQKPKMPIKIITEKKQVQAKLFQPAEIVPSAIDRKRSKQKMPVQAEIERLRGGAPEKSSRVKVVLNNRFEFKEREEECEPMFKNNYLKSVGKDEVRSERRSDFIIRKKNPYDDKNSVSLFNSVLASLRKGKK